MSQVKLSKGLWRIGEENLWEFEFAELVFSDDEKMNDMELDFLDLENFLVKLWGGGGKLNLAFCL